MSAPWSDLLAILDLEQLEHNLFRGHSPKSGWQRVFGGQVIGQALVAAQRTVDGPPAPFAARLFHAARRPQGADHLRGRPHPRRRAASPPGAWSAIQHGQAIFSLSASFQVDEDGLRASVRDAATCPRPTTLPSEEEMQGEIVAAMPEPMRTYWERDRPIEMRPVELEHYMSREAASRASMSGSAPPARCRTIRRSIRRVLAYVPT